MAVGSYRTKPGFAGNPPIHPGLSHGSHASRLQRVEEHARGSQHEAIARRRVDDSRERRHAMGPAERGLDERDRIAVGSPLGRIGEADEVADVVAFLASDQARWVTGQHLLANGGARV